MSRLTPAFLVLLRLAIGWQIFFAGMEKVRAPNWTSEPYLRESSGPLAEQFRNLAGDGVVERLTPVQGASGPVFPPALDQDWQGYYDRFVAHYELNPEQQTIAKGKLDQRKDAALTWMRLGEKTVKKTGPSGLTVDVTMTTPERIAEYQAKVKEARTLQDKEMWTFAGGAGPRLRAAKADAARLRADLQDDIKDQTAQLKKSLQEVQLTDEQKQKKKDVLVEDYELARGKAPLPPGPPLSTWSLLRWSDAIVKWGLGVVGVCLLMGLFTRTACVAGAGFILMFSLAMPALGGLVPENPKAEGLELLVTKNIIEVLALLALATTSSGKWVGLDGLVQFLNPFRRKPQETPPPPANAGGSPNASLAKQDLGIDTPRPDLTNGHAAPQTVTADSAPVPVLEPEPRDTDHGH